MTTITRLIVRPFVPTEFAVLDTSESNLLLGWSRLHQVPGEVPTILESVTFDAEREAEIVAAVEAMADVVLLPEVE